MSERKQPTVHDHSFACSTARLPFPREARQLAIGALLAGFVVGTTSVTASAQVMTCDPSYYAWSPPTPSTAAGPASAPALIAGDTLYYPNGNPIIYLAQGSTLYAIRRFADEGQPGGSIKWTWQAAPPPLPQIILPSSPNPIRSRGQEFVFLTGEDGFLYKIRGNANTATTVLMRDTRRRIGGVLVCQSSPGDGVLASPAVQLYELSNGDFQAAADAAGHCGDDLVFVVTANGCGDRTRNRVIACWASDLSVAWTFNEGYERKVDRSTGGFTIDYATNTLFLGTDLADDATGQSSLFALDAITGQLKWATNAGAILNRPTLAGGRLYVGTKPGSVMAYNPLGNGTGGGAPLWASPVSATGPGAIITRNMAPFSAGLLIVDTGGTLHAVRDNQTSGTLLWILDAESGVQYRSAPVVLQLMVEENAYIGRDDGTIQQILLGPANATPRGVMAVDGPSVGMDVCDPTLDLEPGAPEPHHLVVAAVTGKVTRIHLPICNTAPFGPDLTETRTRTSRR